MKNTTERQVIAMSETEKQQKEESKVAEMPESMKKRIVAYEEAIRRLSK